MLQEDRFCSRCATPLDLQSVEGKERPVCPDCGYIVYYDPKLVAIVVIHRDGQVLMVRRAREPGRLKWSLPGGYVDRGELVEGAAVREALEETGLEVRVTGLVGLFSESEHLVVIAAYDSEIIGGEMAPGSEVLDLGFFSLDKLPSMAFPQNYQVLESWRRRRSDLSLHD